MDRKIGFGLLLFALVAIAVAILSPGGRTVDPNPRLPWMIEVDVHGESRVFGLTLGESTLADAREQFQEQGKMNLFLSPQGEYAIEAYFQRLFLSGLRADMVLSLDVGQQQAAEIFERGLRISKLGSGTKKVDMTMPDQDLLAGAAISRITYLPATDLDEEILIRHFGEPQQKFSEKKSEIVHWLYPHKGLDIAVNPDDKEVFQYVRPSEFEELMKPLDDQKIAQ
ncbi:MAG: hypothetical protein U9Q75_12125 [Pseudomonadota bacterium]|nr:hypothetical protein [Pseudomonadota bacterium]